MIDSVVSRRMIDQNSAVASVAAMLLRALERAAKLYEVHVSSAEAFDPKLMEDGVRLATALDRLRKASEEIAHHERDSASALDDAQTRDLLTRLETEIEEKIAQRVAALAEGLPAKCPQCGSQLPKLETAQKPKAAKRK